jgi:hypothetical protein
VILLAQGFALVGLDRTDQENHEFAFRKTFELEQSVERFNDKLPIFVEACRLIYSWKALRERCITITSNMSLELSGNIIKTFQHTSALIFASSAVFPTPSLIWRCSAGTPAASPFRSSIATAYSVSSSWRKRLMTRTTVQRCWRPRVRRRSSTAGGACNRLHQRSSSVKVSLIVWRSRVEAFAP